MNKPSKITKGHDVFFKAPASGVSRNYLQAPQGRSTIEVQCQCCQEFTQVSVWSFRGQGKRCNNCNSLITNSGTWADSKTKLDVLNDEHFKSGKFLK